MSHTLISLLLFAQVGRGAPPPSPLCPARSLSHSRSLPLSPSLLSVFVPRGPVVQLKLSVTQINQIGFHLQPVTSCVHCASVLPLSAEEKYRFLPMTMLLLLALSRDFYIFQIKVSGATLLLNQPPGAPCSSSMLGQSVCQALDITHVGAGGAQKQPKGPKSHANPVVQRHHGDNTASSQAQRWAF